MAHSNKKSARSNTDRLSHGKKIAALKKKTRLNRAEECTFDPVARAEYLTGFHKRKVERRNIAAGKLKEESRTSKLAMRADLRRQRAEELRQRMDAHRANLGLDSDGEEIQDSEEWFGFDNDDHHSSSKGRGNKLWQVEEYEDDAKTVSVTVEEMT